MPILVAILLCIGIYRNAAGAAEILIPLPSSEATKAASRSISLQLLSQSESNTLTAPIVIQTVCNGSDATSAVTGYPFREQKGCIQLFSQFPLSDVRFPAYGDDMSPVFAAKIIIDQERVVDLYLVAFEPPSTQESWNDNRIALRRLSTDLRHSPRSVIVAGMFGSGSFGRLYEGFRDAARLDDVWDGSGLRYFGNIRPGAGSPMQHVLFKGRIDPKAFESSASGLLFSFDLFPN